MPDDGFFHASLTLFRELRMAAWDFKETVVENNEEHAAYLFFSETGDYGLAAKVFIGQLAQNFSLESEDLNAQLGAFLRNCGEHLSDADAKDLILELRSLSQD